MLEDNFWDNYDKANRINGELSFLKKEIKQVENIELSISNLKDLIAFLEKEEDSELQLEIGNDISKLSGEITELETQVLLSSENDKLNCYLEIHPGAGGTESCDWAAMLFRMYTRFCEKNDYSYEVIEEQKGEEAGLKSVTILIKGLFAYGYFKTEKGVHRLVRISPFDSNARRHTSFASVSIIPEIDTEIDIEIDEKDLKIDVYRSSGKGGQGVNTTDSAVRITHLPSKIVVTCQNERSQIKNKETAMKVLKSKLYQLKIEEKGKELKELKGQSSNIEFGNQIRSYVLEPYTLVKDMRTNYETTRVDKVLDGDIKEFMIAMLKQ